ncbi:substrate-binding domain-containing protein [Amycolatopsis sp. NPDC049253]|uniref:substrate-binding domain-containing protein n=1 Tax=Amycolatopsis sp. NPDC049253 TaxID=3155274 RepID=UPI003448A4EB
MAASTRCGPSPAAKPTAPRSTCATATATTTPLRPSPAPRRQPTPAPPLAPRTRPPRPPRNPRNLTTPANLPGLLVARREQGAGTRVLLDQLLVAHDIPPHAVSGPELNSHLEIALAVATGTADTGLGIRAHTTELELDFIPVTWESYDIALPESALGVAQPLRTALRTPTVHTAITNLGGYDLTNTGELRKASGP